MPWCALWHSGRKGKGQCQLLNGPKLIEFRLACSSSALLDRVSKNSSWSVITAFKPRSWRVRKWTNCLQQYQLITVPEKLSNLSARLFDRWVSLSFIWPHSLTLFVVHFDQCPLLTIANHHHLTTLRAPTFSPNFSWSCVCTSFYDTIIILNVGILTFMVHVAMVKRVHKENV